MRGYSCTLSLAAFAYAIAALSPSMDVANAVFLTIPGAMLFACGYLIRYNDIKIWLKWCAASTRHATCSQSTAQNSRQPRPGGI